MEEELQRGSYYHLIFPRSGIGEVEHHGLPDLVTAALDLFDRTHDEEVTICVNDWLEELWWAQQQLQVLGVVDNSVDITRALLDWIDPKNEEHGAYHSYCVYQGCLEIARSPEFSQNHDLDLTDPDVLGMFGLMSVIHDFARYFTGVHFATGVSIENWDAIKMPKHAAIMSSLILQLGPHLQFGQELLQQLQRNIFYHDFSYEQRSAKKKKMIVDRLDSIGKIFYDADKLLGFGTVYDPRKLAEDALKRNRAGSKGPTGWYWFISEFTPQDRQDWQYGRRWFSDGLSAVKKEMDLEYLTQYGQEVAKQRKKEFIDQMIVFYAKEYTQIKNDLERTLVIFRKDPRRVKLYKVGKDQGKQVIELPDDFDRSWLPKVISPLYYEELPLSAKYARGRTPARGWKLIVEVDGVEKPVIDPSIARYVTLGSETLGVEAFIADLVTVFFEEEE